MAKIWVTLAEISSSDWATRVVADVVMAGATLLARQDSPREKRVDFQVEIADDKAADFYWKYRQRPTYRAVMEWLMPQDPFVQFVNLARAEAEADADSTIPDHT